MKIKSLFFTLSCFLLLVACATIDTPSSPDNPALSASPYADDQSKTHIDGSSDGKQNDFGLQGRYTVLTTATDGERPESYGNLLEFPNSVIVSSYMPNMQWNVEQFEIGSGKSIDLIEVSDYSDRGNFYEIAYTQNKDGYDYCLLFEKGILYRSSSKQRDDIFESLPPDVTLQAYNTNSSMAPYQRNEKSYIWAGKDGIMLTPLDKGETVCILPNDKISDAFIDSKFPDAYKNAAYSVPRFVNNETGVVVQVRNQNDDLIGMALYNFKDKTIGWSVELGPPFEPTIYPVADRYICIGNGGSRIIDTLTGTVDALSLTYFFKTYDGQQFVQIEVSSQDYTDFKAFLCSADKLDDRSNMILSSDGANGIYIPSISKNYLTVASENAETFWLALVSYTDNPPFFGTGEVEPSSLPSSTVSNIDFNKKYPDGNFIIRVVDSQNVPLINTRIVANLNYPEYQEMYRGAVTNSDGMLLLLGLYI